MTNAAKPAMPTAAGIITDATSGERVIPASTRPDGTTRRAIRIRPGYRPPEDVELYKNRTAETFRTRNTGPVPGAEGLVSTTGNDSGAATGASNKNAKRREARKKAKAASSSTTTTPAAAGAAGATAAAAAAAAEGGGGGDDSGDVEPPTNANAAVTAENSSKKPAQPEAKVDREKKAKNLRKKLRQARELQQKKEGGESLLPEQIAKVIKINELVRELEAMGFHTDGEPTKAGDGQTDSVAKESPAIADAT